MEDYGGFQAQFASVMENVLKSAVGETSRLFERTLQQLRAELLHLRQENAELKSGLSARRSSPAQPAERPLAAGTGPDRRDIGVQCEKPLMVERCCSPAPFGQQPLHLRDITNDRLADLCSGSSEDETRQLALLLIKKEPQETSCDDYAPGYFLLKQEGAEPVLVRKEPFKNTMEKVMIPSAVQTVTRCFGNPREISTASTASTTNAVSSNQGSSHNKVIQNTSMSTINGLASQSDKETQICTPVLPELSANSSPTSITTVSLPSPADSLSSKLVQVTTCRAHSTAPAVSLQTTQRREQHTPMLKTSQSSQTVQNIQKPAAVPHSDPQLVPCPLLQQNIIKDTCTSIQSSPAPAATTNKRVLSAQVNQVMTALARSSTQIVKPLLPPLESVVTQVQNLTTLNSFSSPRSQVPISQPQIIPSTNHISNSPVQSSMQPVQGQVPPIQSLFPPVQGSLQSVQSPVPPVQNPVSSIQGPVPPVQSLSTSIQSSVPLTQSAVPPIQDPVPPIQSLLPHVQGQVTPVQVPVPLSKVSVRPIQISVPPDSSTVPPSKVNAQTNEINPPHSQSLPISHFPSASHHNLASSAQPPYPATNVPFAQSYISSQLVKSVSPVSIPQTNSSSPLEQIPITTSHYQILPDPLCSSSDQFFPSPDNASDLLQTLPPMSFHSPIVLTHQQAALEQPSMIHSQSSEQPLQLAPLLTLKEQQAAASNQGILSKRGPTMAAEIPLAAVSSFEEHIQRFPSCSSPNISCEDNDSVPMDIQNKDSTEKERDGCPSLMPGMREHYKVLSKPQSNFRVLDSPKEQHVFRINAGVGPQIDSDVSKQSQSGLNALPYSALSASVPDRARTLQKASRRVLEKNTECSECGRILSNASSLENHMRLHRGERPYNCSQCGKAFPSVRGLNRHMKVHAEEKGYKCEDCGRSFVYQFTLTKHKLIHSGDRPYPCKVCGKKFLAKADRSTHMRMHTGEKPFFCNQCGKTFKHRVALNMHVQGHRGEKRYVCPHCEKGFVDLGNFKRHKRIHTGEKPFECKECGKRFTQSAHLKKHVNTQHAVSKAN